MKHKLNPYYGEGAIMRSILLQEFHLSIERSKGNKVKELLANTVKEFDFFGLVYNSAEEAYLKYFLPRIGFGESDLNALAPEDMRNMALASGKCGLWDELKVQFEDVVTGLPIDEQDKFYNNLHRAKRANSRKTPGVKLLAFRLIIDWIPCCLWMMSPEDIPHWMSKHSETPSDSTTVRKYIKQYGLKNYSDFNETPIITGFKTKDCPFIFDVKWKKLDPTMSH